MKWPRVEEERKAALAMIRSGRPPSLSNYLIYRQEFPTPAGNVKGYADVVRVHLESDEFFFRTGMTYGLLLAKGLVSCKNDILRGLNNSTRHLKLDDSNPDYESDIRNRWAESDAMADYIPKYIERWQMYRRMFERTDRRRKQAHASVQREIEFKPSYQEFHHGTGESGEYRRLEARPGKSR